MKPATHLLCTFAFIAALAVQGCGDGGSSPSPAASLPANLFLDDRPAEVLTVLEAKERISQGERVAVHGRIGGTVNPFVNGRAVMTIVDLALPTCADKPDDCCETPWDYCCEERSDVVAHAATVQVVDSAGQLLHANLNGAGGLEPMAEIIVVGKVGQTASPTAFLVEAEGIYVIR